MSPEVKSVLVDESAITLTLTIPVDWNADRPLAHLTNEGHIKEGLRQAGQIATQRLYQTIADRHNAIDTYLNQDGYTLRQDDQSTAPFLSPYGHVEVLRPHFYNDYTHTPATPFEHETRMDEHRITPMMQYTLLRKLMDKGPAACAKDIAEDLPKRVSHHLIDQFLEDMGNRYQALKPELTATVLEDGWEPAWLGCDADCDGVHSGPMSPPAPGRALNDPAPPASGPTPMERVPGRVPVVQMDAMSVTVRRYHDTTQHDKGSGLKYHTERHHVYNAVVGVLSPEGPREAGDKIDLEDRRFFSQYQGRDEVAQTVAQYVAAYGLVPGQTVICQADGDDCLWDSLAAALPGYRRVEILDEQHARKNLNAMADLSYETAPGKPQRWIDKRMDELYEGRYTSFHNALDYVVRRASDPHTRDKLKTKRRYFRRHGKRIRYADFLNMGYPISTCFVESAHRHVIGDRLRNNGRSYREDRLQMIADLRCEYKSERLPYVFERLLETAA